MKIIDSITIRYFRSVYTLNIGQCEDITIVSGRNDVGKSNILKALNLRNEKFVKIGKNIFAFSIPVPHARAESNQISIEHYFTDEEIKTELEGKRLFIGNEFYKTGVCKSNPSLYYKSGARVADTIKIIEHESNNYVMNADGTGDYSISKSAFVNAICEEKDSFKGFSFDEFQKIFDVINSIVSSSKE